MHRGGLNLKTVRVFPAISHTNLLIDLHVLSKLFQAALKFKELLVLGWVVYIKNRQERTLEWEDKLSHWTLNVMKSEKMKIRISQFLNSELSTASRRLQCSTKYFFKWSHIDPEGVRRRRRRDVSSLTLRKKKILFLLRSKVPNVYHTRDRQRMKHQQISGLIANSQSCSMSDLRLQRIDKIFVFSRLTRNRLHTISQDLVCGHHQSSIYGASLRSGSVFELKTNNRAVAILFFSFLPRYPFSHSEIHDLLRDTRKQRISFSLISHFKINYLKPKTYDVSPRYQAESSQKRLKNLFFMLDLAVRRLILAGLCLTHSHIWERRSDVRRCGNKKAISKPSRVESHELRS